MLVSSDAHIDIAIGTFDSAVKLLEEEKIDIGLIGKPDSLKNINFYPLQEIEDIFVATKDYLHNLRVRGVTANTILQNSTLMLLDKENMTRQYIDDYLQENHIVIEDSIDISNMDLLIEFAKIGVGVACVIKSFIKEELKDGTLVEVPIGFPIHKREVGFAHKSNQKPSKSLQDFIKFYETFTPEA